MGCVIKYKGQSIPEEQFLQYLNKQIAINNLFETNGDFASKIYEALGFDVAQLKEDIAVTNAFLTARQHEEAKRINSGEFDDTKLDLKTELQNIIDNSTNPLLVELAKSIQNKGSLKTIKAYSTQKPFKTKEGFEPAAAYQAETQKLVLFLGNTARFENKEREYQYLLHELVHHFVDRELVLTNSKQAENIRQLFKYTKYQLTKAGKENLYGLTNFHEFVTEALTNSDFQKELKSLQAPDQFLTKSFSIFDYFLELISKVLGTNKSVLEAVVSQAADIFELQEYKKSLSITPQQKQQAQQLYSQYLEQNPNGSVEQFKSWLDEFNNKRRFPLQPTEEQLKYIKPLPEKLIEQINSWKNRSNKEILETLKLYAEVYTKDKELETLIQMLITNVDKIKFVKFKGVGKLENNNHQAEYDGETGEIFVNNIMYQPNNRDIEDRLYRTIIHEYLHGYFLSVLNSPTTTQEKELVEYINEAYDVLTFEYEGTEKWYGFSNVDEFVSELLSNKEFRESEQVKKTGIIQKILNFINQIFFKKYGKNSIEIKQNTFNKILENISILEPNLVKYSNKKGSLSDFISQKSQERLNQVQELFETNPELANIGTPEQYSQYLNTIFPDSKVKDIVYHGTKGYNKITGEELPKFEKFDKSFIGKGQGLRSDDMAKGFYFGSYKIADRVGTRIIPAILNVQEENNTTVRRATEDFDTKGDVFVVFEPEQIHILGSKQDIEGFKKFVEQPIQKEIKDKLIRTMTSEKKKLAEQGDLEAQREWIREEISEFYDALRGKNTDEIGEETIGLFRTAQQFPKVDNELNPYLTDIKNALNSFDYNEQFTKWKAKKESKNQAKDVTLESLKEFIDKIQEQPIVEETKQNIEEIEQKIQELTKPFVPVYVKPDIFKIARDYNMTQTGFFPAAVNPNLIRTAVRPLGLDVAQTSNKNGYYLTKNDRMFNPYKQATSKKPVDAKNYKGTGITKEQWEALSSKEKEVLLWQKRNCK